MQEICVQLPPALENMTLPAPELVSYYQDAEHRRFWIDAEIDMGITEITKSILRINEADKGKSIEERLPIKLLLFSPGGDLDVTLSLIDIISLSKTPVWTYNMGLSASGAGLILMAGHKRFCLPKSTVLIHSGSGQIGGNYEAVTAAMDDYRRAIEIMRDYILSATNIDQKIWNKNKSKEWYIYADEQIQYGIVHKIINDIDEVL